MGHRTTDQVGPSSRRRAALWFGIIAAAPALVWCCDRGMKDLHRRSVINCFRNADRVSVEYTAMYSPSDDPRDMYTITGRNEITNPKQLAVIARHLSGIQIDEVQSNDFFILPGSIFANWGLPYEVSVYNSQDATRRQFRIYEHCLHEVGREGRVFSHTGEGLRGDLRAGGQVRPTLPGATKGTEGLPD